MYKCLIAMSVSLVTSCFLLACKPDSIRDSQPENLNDFDDRIVQVFAKKSDNTYSYGAGFIITEAGTFLTAAHIITDSETGRLYREFKARLVKGDSREIVQVNLVHNFANDSPSHDLALFQLIASNRIKVSYPFFVLADMPAKRTPIVIAGFPEIYGSVPKGPVYREGILATKFVINDVDVAILDMPPLKGFSGGPVIDLSTDVPTVFAVVKGFAAEKGADLTAAHVLPAIVIQAKLKEYNAQKKYFELE